MKTSKLLFSNRPFFFHPRVFDVFTGHCKYAVILTGHFRSGHRTPYFTVDYASSQNVGGPEADFEGSLLGGPCAQDPL